MDTVHECDRRTDRRTDGQTDRITITKTVQRIASHGKNEVMSNRKLQLAGTLEVSRHCVIAPVFVMHPYYFVLLKFFRAIDWGCMPPCSPMTTPCMYLVLRSQTVSDTARCSILREQVGRRLDLRACLKFLCRGNKDRPHNILHGSIESAIPEKPLVGPDISGLSTISIQADL